MRINMPVFIRQGGCTEQIVYYHVNAEVQIKPGPLRVY